MLSRRPLVFSAVLASAVLCATSNVCAQDPLKAFPNNYKLALDNTQIRVLRCHYGPHEKVGVHNHSDYPTVYVYLSDSGPVRFSHVEEHPFVMTRPPVKAGSFRVSPGRPERHTVENLSDLSSDYLRIELKQIPLHSTLHPTRSEAPADLGKASTETAFNDPELTIQRIVSIPTQDTTLPAANFPSLLVAFTPIKLGGSAQKALQPGEVFWLPASGPLTIAAASTGPAHLLRIEFHKK
jgi:hypothetical protein